MDYRPLLTMASVTASYLHLLATMLVICNEDEIIKCKKKDRTKDKKKEKITSVLVG